MLLGLLAATTLAAVPPAPAGKTLAELDSARFELHLGGRAGARALGGASFGGGGQIGLGVRLWQGLYLEVTVGEGVFTSPRASKPTESFRHFGLHGGLHGEASEAEPTNPDDATTSEVPLDDAAASALLAGQILMGLRYEVRTPRTERMRPSVFLGVTHLHEATLEQFVDAPGKTLAGIGDFIVHRTGVQLGVGLRIPFRSAPRFSLRIDTDAAYYFDDHPGRLQAGLGLGLQAVF